MSPHEGRIEKRMRLAVPLAVSKLWDPAGAEHTITEDVCSSGVRVLTRRAMEPNERLMIRAFQGDLQIQARVVYCHRLPDGRYGVGLRFQKADVDFLSAVRRRSQNQGRKESY
jgi:PilZ domain